MLKTITSLRRSPHPNLGKVTIRKTVDLRQLDPRCNGRSRATERGVRRSGQAGPSVPLADAREGAAQELRTH